MTKRTWFITDVSSGFGRAMTEQLLAHGDRVAGTVRRLAAMDDLAAKYAERLWLAELDITDTAATRRVVDRAFAEPGRVEVVVNNAGYAVAGAAEELTDEQVVHQLNSNLLGSIQVVRCALPHLRRQGRARILQLSSVAGQAAFAGASLYHASKWGIEAFIDSVAQEVAPFGIECTLIEPSGARTSFFSRGRTSSAGLRDAPRAGVDRRGTRVVMSPPPMAARPREMGAQLQARGTTTAGCRG
jgi:NAD(P)-dependent dehydrogenase (short-subunit alcohol dehydrogenase family)